MAGVAAVLVMMLVSSLASATPPVRTLTPGSMDLPEGISVEAFATKLREAANAWSYPQVACTSVELQVTEPEARRLAVQDGTSLVVFRSNTWCHNERCGHDTTFPLRAAAMTTTYSAEASHDVPEADIELNGRFYGWPPLDARAQRDRDLESTGSDRVRTVPLRAVLVHEIGHVLGFDDACPHVGTRDERSTKRCSRDAPLSAMNEVARLEAPSAEDIRTLCARFPRVQAAHDADDQVPDEPSAAHHTGLVLGLMGLSAGFGLFASFRRRRLDESTRKEMVK